MASPPTAPDPALLDAVLDALIPPDPDRRLPGAGALGLGRTILARSGGMATIFASLLAHLETEAARAHGTPFVALAPEDREALLRALDEERAGLLAGLYFQAFTTYYAHPEVMEQLGVAARPPHPEGYPLEAGDLGLLAAVRGRGRLWREP